MPTPISRCRQISIPLEHSHIDLFFFRRCIHSIKGHLNVLCVLRWSGNSLNKQSLICITRLNIIKALSPAIPKKLYIPISLIDGNYEGMCISISNSLFLRSGLKYNPKVCVSSHLKNYRP